MDGDLFHSLAFAWIALGAYAQLIGMPIVWLRLRRSAEWRAVAGMRKIDLLARLLDVPTALTIVWGYLALLAVAAVDGTAIAYAVVIYGPPLVFVTAMALAIQPEEIAEAGGR